MSMPEARTAATMLACGDRAIQRGHRMRASLPDALKRLACMPSHVANVFPDARDHVHAGQDADGGLVEGVGDRRACHVLECAHVQARGFEGAGGVEVADRHHRIAGTRHEGGR